MRNLAIVLCIIVAVVRPASAWEYNEHTDQFNGKMLASCVEDYNQANIANKLVELCFIRFLKTDLVQLIMTFDRGDICDGDIIVAYRLDGGKVEYWDAKLVHSGTDSFVVFKWNWVQTRALANGSHIIFRLGDSCDFFYDMSFLIPSRPHEDVFCCY